MGTEGHGASEVVQSPAMGWQPDLQESSALSSVLSSVDLPPGHGSRGVHQAQQGTRHSERSLPYWSCGELTIVLMSI